MKIGIDCRLWNQTGVGRYIRNLVEQLQILDNQNDYVLFMQSKDRQEFRAQSSKFKVVTADIRWHSVEEQVIFPQILNKEKLDLMHFPYFSVPIFYNKPFIVTIHDLIIHHFGTGKASTLPKPLYHLKRIGYTYVSLQAMKKAKKIIVPLNTVKEDLVKTLGVSKDRIVVTHEGVDKNFEFKAEILDPNIKKYFLYVGNAYPHKNLDRLIEAYVAFRKEGKNDAQLVLVGKNDYFYKKLHERVALEHLDGVYFKHGIPDAELASLYEHAIALVSPSLMEGFGLPPLEAMAFGAPLLLSDIPAFKEVCENVAFYFDPRSVNDIKEKMKFMYNLGKQEKQEHGKKGFERMKDFSWEKMARQTLAVYEGSFSL
jgi:glycosyltransferase involved in cell wall biosynthesis